MVLQVSVRGAGQPAPPLQGGLSSAGVRSLSFLTTLSWDPGCDLGGDIDGVMGVPKESGRKLIPV